MRTQGEAVGGHGEEVLNVAYIIGSSLSPYIYLILFVFHCEVCDHIQLHT